MSDDEFSFEDQSAALQAVTAQPNDKGSIAPQHNSARASIGTRSGWSDDEDDRLPIKCDAHLDEESGHIEVGYDHTETETDSEFGDPDAIIHTGPLMGTMALNCKLPVPASGAAQAQPRTGSLIPMDVEIANGSMNAEQWTHQSGIASHTAASVTNANAITNHPGSTISHAQSLHESLVSEDQTSQMVSPRNEGDSHSTAPLIPHLPLTNTPPPAPPSPPMTCMTASISTPKARPPVARSASEKVSQRMSAKRLSRPQKQRSFSAGTKSGRHSPARASSCSRGASVSPPRQPHSARSNASPLRMRPLSPVPASSLSPRGVVIGKSPRLISQFVDEPIPQPCKDPPTWVSRLYIPPRTSRLQARNLAAQAYQDSLSQKPKSHRTKPKPTGGNADKSQNAVRGKHLQCPKDSVWSQLYTSALSKKARLSRKMEEELRKKAEEEEYEMKDHCTFTPSITAAARNAYHATDEEQQDVVNRLTKYHPKKQQVQREKKVQSIVQQDMVDCTFRPKINPHKNSDTAVSNCHSRLYQDALQRNHHRQLWAELWAGIPIMPQVAANSTGLTTDIEVDSELT